VASRDAGGALGGGHRTEGPTDLCHRVKDLVLDGSDKTSSMIASLSSAVHMVEDCIDVAAINGVHWVARLALIATLSHFPELGPELELLGF
jgi:hypothetical protein